MSREQKAALRELMPRDSEGAKVFNAYRSTLRYACQNCRLGESELEEGKRLRGCAGCSKIGRKVCYCSSYVRLRILNSIRI